MGNSLHILSHPPTQQLCIISFFTEVSFCILEITLHATKTATLNKRLFPVPFSSPSQSQEISHLYSQPFKFRQVTKSVQLQTFQVVEMQVPVTHKSHTDHTQITHKSHTDCNLRGTRSSQINPPVPPSHHSSQGRC